MCSVLKKKRIKEQTCSKLMASSDHACSKAGSLLAEGRKLGEEESFLLLGHCDFCCVGLVVLHKVVLPRMVTKVTQAEYSKINSASVLPGYPHPL